MFNRSGATRAVALGILGFGMLVFFTNLSLMKFQVRYLALFLLFSVKDELFWMAILHKNVQLMLESLKAPFLVLHFSYYSLMTFLLMLSVILLLCWWYYSLFLVWSSIWSVATTWIGFLIWIWSMRHSGLGQEVACWFQCWKNSTVFFWPV